MPTGHPRKATESTELCPCGFPLHYQNIERREAVQDIIAEKGAYINLATADGTWSVPRHYIALHGIGAIDLAYLAEKYGWEKVK
jgi:hypothetical protein